MTSQNVLVTGGCGFIGAHAAAHFRKRGARVLCADNLSRKGSNANAEWLGREHQVEVERVDVRDAGGIAKVVSAFQPDFIIHAAGQVAVTTSVTDPRRDFEDNLLGTFNTLEAARALPRKPILLYTSTNKVYGGMEDVGVELRDGRYAYKSLPEGCPETRGLDFHSPYGCSKGAADQYVRDYHRIYGLPTVVFRQSCIYGPRQFGVEDQGWVAWFTIRAVQGRNVTIYGDGRQVRDVLHVEDLVRAFETAFEQREKVAGEIFNVGGGPKATLSLLELLDELERIDGRPVQHQMADWRPGDQRVFVADIRRIGAVLGWQPKILPAQGVRSLYAWVRENLAVVERELNR
ncbi:MAG: SDR family NAD(P)-dependent oxidoreductase [Myxococcota bacterium]